MIKKRKDISNKKKSPTVNAELKLETKNMGQDAQV